MRILYTKLLSYSLFYRQTKWYMQKITSVTGIICAKCQNYNMYVRGLILLSVLKTTKHTMLYPGPLLLSRNEVFCLKNWKLRRAPTALEFNIFCWNFAHVFYLVMPTKVCVGFFFLFRSWVINKSVKNKCVETRSFLIFANNRRSKQN